MNAMNAPRRSSARFASPLSSVRARLTLWNTLTFALVLVTLGVAFRYLAQKYLLNALDREIKVQAQRFQDKHHVQMLFITDHIGTGDLKGLLPQKIEKDVLMRMLPLSAKMSTVQVSGSQLKSTIHVSSSPQKTEYRIVQNLNVPSPDKSGQFLYRAFTLEGKPLSPGQPAPIPESLFLNGMAIPESSRRAEEEYRPWDTASFQAATRGQERLVSTEANGARLRVLSQPLREADKIIGVVQIATPLGQVYRDIAGLSHMLLLTLPIALLIASGAGVFLTDRALRPVKSLTLAANDIRADQLSQRLPVSGADEFDALATTFNHALDRVEQAFLDREQAMEQLRRFTADASHELRTPLTTIKVNTGVALKEPEPSEEHVHALRQIDRAADRMTALVRDLLLLARSDSGQMMVVMRPVVLEDVVREAQEMVAAHTQVPITLHIRTAGRKVCGDGESLCRLFLNLLENAARHTPADGHICLHIEDQKKDQIENQIETPGGSLVVVRVEDTGCGIAPEHLAHLGERFYRADAGRNRKQGGAGLGLAICRSIVAQHKGTLAIASEPGKGTTITICLPCCSGNCHNCLPS